MSRSAAQLREDALAIWQAGVDAVRSDRLVTGAIRLDDGQLAIGPQTPPLAGRDSAPIGSGQSSNLLSLNQIGRIAVVGCGKAGAGMAAGLEAALGDDILREKRVEGWVNVPDDCVRELKRIHVHGARPPGVNEPTAQGVEGAERILQIASSLGPNDVCFCLISGGGSALLPAPAEGITLEDKLAVTRHLSAAGANIQQLNAVRKQLSRIKGGGLARACTAGHLIALIISDVIGDPLDVIASGPTVPDSSTPQQALAVLEQFGARAAGISDRVFDFLAKRAETVGSADRRPTCRVANLVIGNNATAVEAAGQESRRRGYATRTEAFQHLEGEAEQVGRRLAAEAVRMRRAGGRQCLVSGGEPTVKLAPTSQRGRGGRNQQLALAALEELLSDSLDGIVLLSGGTDGEDGPTDAAGAWVDADVDNALRGSGLSPADYLRRNDAYSFFERFQALIRTGPTHTNVCDLRVVVTEPAS